MMAATLIAVSVTAALLAITVLRRRAIPDQRPAPPTFDPADVADLTTRFAGVEAEHSARQSTLLEVHLRPLVARRVPVQCVEPLPARRTNRVRFADGTAVTVKGETAGDAGVLAMAIRRHRVLPGTCSTDARGTHLVFDWSDGRRHLSLLVTGLDQPD